LPKNKKEKSLGRKGNTMAKCYLKDSHGIRRETQYTTTGDAPNEEVEKEHVYFYDNPETGEAHQAYFEDGQFYYESVEPETEEETSEEPVTPTKSRKSKSTNQSPELPDDVFELPLDHSFETNE
jgi:hypothetical protein